MDYREIFPFQQWLAQRHPDTFSALHREWRAEQVARFGEVYRARVRSSDPATELDLLERASLLDATHGAESGEIVLWLVAPDEAQARAKLEIALSEHIGDGWSLLDMKHDPARAPLP